MDINSNKGKSFKVLPTYQEGFHDDKKISQMPYNLFGKTGIDVSLMGFGGSALALCYDTPYEQEAVDTVIAAIKSGINYIDTAPFYGQGKAELVLGKALKLIPRNAYYLATKVGRYGPDVHNMFDFSAERTLRSVQESLLRLGIDSFDILQVHDLEFALNLDVVINETLPVLQKLKDAGKTKYIGITGYPVSTLKQVIEKSQIKIDVVLSYCRATLFDDTLSTYIPYLRLQFFSKGQCYFLKVLPEENDLAIVNAAALGMGLLTKNGPPDWHPAGLEVKNLCQQASNFCRNKNVDIAKLAAYHSFSQSGSDTNLIGMKNKEELKSNLDCVINGLTPDESVIKEEIQQKFFKNAYFHWENVEVKQYREKMKHLGL